MKRSPLRYFLLGPVIVLLAFSLHSTALTVVQVIAGVLYTSLGFFVRRA